MEGVALFQILQMCVLVAVGAVIGGHRQLEGYIGRPGQDRGCDLIGGPEDPI